MKLSVIVPTHRRAEALQRCLQGVYNQIRSPDEVCIIAHHSDEGTLALLEHWRHWPVVKVVLTPTSGQVSQLNCGLDAALGDIVAITDDDAIPRPEWLRNIEQHFLANPDLGGVGGRDLVQENGSLLVGEAHLVGTVQWFGRVVGNHHIGTRMFKDVDILKGANMSYRALAVGNSRFDSDLRGKGAQTCNDLAFSLSVQKRGWRLLYDPAVAVDHFPAQRFDADQRKARDPITSEDNAFNFYLALRRHMKTGMRQRMALFWAWSVGTQTSPGSIRSLLFRLKGDVAGVERRRSALRAWQAAKRVNSA